MKENAYNEEKNEEEDYPECPICYDIYGINAKHIKTPKVLECGDTLCKECLENLIKREKEEFFFVLCVKRK